MECFDALGTITNGKLKVQDRADFERAMAQFEDGEVSVTVTVISDAALRTLRANRYYRGPVLNTIAEWSGNDPDYLHEQMKKKFLTETGTNINRKTGEVMEYQRIGSTAKLSSSKFTWFVDSVIQLAEEFFEKTIPPPDQDYHRKRKAA